MEAYDWLPEWTYISNLKPEMFSKLIVDSITIHKCARAPHWGGVHDELFINTTPVTPLSESSFSGGAYGKLQGKYSNDY